MSSSPLRILVVEDDLQLLGYLCALFADWGHNCTQASSAMEALAIVERQCPDVILSDLVMPRVGGVDLLKALKRNTHNRCAGCPMRNRVECGPIFFILVTGYGTASAAIKAIMEGADEVLLKPLDEDVLCGLLERVAAERHPGV